MTVEKMVERFTKYFNDEIGRFDLVDDTGYVTHRPDLYALQLLEELAPSAGNILMNAEDSVVRLDVDFAALAENISKRGIKTLLNCGVSYDEVNDYLILCP